MAGIIILASQQAIMNVIHMRVMRGESSLSYITHSYLNISAMRIIYSMRMEVLNNYPAASPPASNLPVLFLPLTRRNPKKTKERKKRTSESDELNELLFPNEARHSLSYYHPSSKLQERVTVGCPTHSGYGFTSCVASERPPLDDRY